MELKMQSTIFASGSFIQLFRMPPMDSFKLNRAGFLFCWLNGKFIRQNGDAMSQMRYFDTITPCMRYFILLFCFFFFVGRFTFLPHSWGNTFNILSKTMIAQNKFQRKFDSITRQCSFVYQIRRAVRCFLFFLLLWLESFL